MAKLEFPPISDRVFRKLFADDDSDGLTRALVADLMGIEVSEIKQFEVLDTDVPADRPDLKVIRHDRLVVVNGRLVDVEVQRADPDGKFRERLGYYWSRENNLALRKGQKYDAQAPVTVIAIVGFRMFDHSSYETRLTTGPMELIRDLAARRDYGELDTVLAGEYPSDYDVRILEVPKAPPLTGPASQYQDTLEGRKVTWLHHFGVSTDDDFSVIEKIGVPAVTMTIGKYRRMLDDPKAVAEFRAEDTDRTERRYEREAGRKEGRAEGEAKGRAEATAQAILTVLEVRGVIVGDADRSRILACTDLAALDVWMLKARRVSDAASLFADSGPVGR